MIVQGVGEDDLGVELKLFVTGELFNLPSKASLLGNVLALPAVTLTLARAVSLGIGMCTRTSFATVVGPYSERRLTCTARRVRPSSLTTGMSLNGSVTLSDTLYLTSSNSPSGGVNSITFSELNLCKRTH